MTKTLKRNSYSINRELLYEIEEFARSSFEKQCKKVNGMREFHFDDDYIPLSYYKRHLLEAILRIRLNNEVDSYCLYKISTKNQKLSKILSKYLAEEFTHDDLFLSDLKKFGISKDEVDSSQVFLSTSALIGNMYQDIKLDGAMPTMVWNWFVEWYSDSFNGFITQKAKEKFGEEKVGGVMTHMNIDEMENHSNLMFSTVEECIKSSEDINKVKNYIEKYCTFIGWYFQELYDTTN